MKYLNETDILKIGIDWSDMIDTIAEAVTLLQAKDYNQPVKPYLRYKDLKNRIIAMPAYLGGKVDTAGIKWIASFPDNIHKNKARAHSVIILNQADSGVPICMINTALVSGIRTAAVTGFVVRKYLQHRQVQQQKRTAGIIGFGPIGQLHLKMLNACFGDQIERFYLFDIKGIDPALPAGFGLSDKVTIVQSWQEVFDKADIFATCTVSTHRYIDAAPRKEVLYLNISLRDFEVDFLRSVDDIIVDHWEEICRENTDIEFAHKTYGLSANDVRSIADLAGTEPSFDTQGQSSTMFNPMGMAIFDMAVAKRYYELAEEKQVGTVLED